jgi:hypothetical protein
LAGDMPMGVDIQNEEHYYPIFDEGNASDGGFG